MDAVRMRFEDPHPAGSSYQRRSTRRSLPSPSMLERVDAILAELAAEETLTLEQMSRRLDLPGSTLHRILQHLVSLQWVERELFDYRLGWRMREFGHRTVQQDRRYRTALPLLYELRDELGLSVHMSVLSGDDSVAVENIWGPGQIPLVGGLFHPAHRTASGKALLVAEWTQSGAAERIPATMTAVERDRIRRTAVATASEELAPGVESVAITIGPIELAISALAVSGIPRSIDPHAVLPPMRRVAAQIFKNSRRRGTPRSKAPQFFH